MRLPLNKILCLTLTSSVSLAMAEEIISAASFSRGNLDEWESQSFKNSTDYELVEHESQIVLRAISHNSASGLLKKISVDLEKTPYINWQWQVKQSLYRLAEDYKEGDDYAARIYVVIDGGIFFWRTLALNYVWASNKPVDSMWSNPFTENAQMLAVESGDQHAGSWRMEKRNVRADLQKAFGRDFRFIDAVAIMTDTDNSGQSATAYYGDIYFSSQ